MRQKCFFTYCWDDPDFVVDVLDYMDHRIEKESNYSIKVTIDRKTLHTADNFKEFEKQIKNSDSVVVFSHQIINVLLSRMIQPVEYIVSINF